MSAPLDLDTIGRVAREGTAPADLLAGVVTTPLPFRQTVPCPYCGGELPGLLALCWEPDCLSREIAADHAYARSLDI